MDYGTFFFANIVSVTVYRVCISLLARYNRRVTGMAWFAGGLLVGLVKLILQGLEGKVPPILSGMLANELYLVSFVMQMMGLRWFVHRVPLRHKWPFAVLGPVLVAYTAMFLLKIPYGGNVINVPNIAVCIATVWILLKYGHLPVSRVSALVVMAQAVVMSYRAWLTNLRYTRPWETVHAQSDPRWLYSLAAAAFLATCMVMCYLWHMVTELNKNLAEQARTDPLTGAMNRRAMEEAALRETARSIRYGHPMCMIVVDVDHFKQLNDAHGHAAGDRALQALVRLANTMLRGNDLLARTGGEEFTILLPDTSSSAGILAAERLRQAIEALQVPFEERSIRLTISAGVAEFDPSQGNWESMMQRADAAMYDAKERGRNAVSPPAPTPQMAHVDDARVL